MKIVYGNIDKNGNIVSGSGDIQLKMLVRAITKLTLTKLFT